MDVAKFVGEKIKEFRKMNGLTQAGLGDKIGFRHNTISDWERGRSSPEQDALFALARTLHVKVDDFFPDQDDKHSLQESLLDSSENLSLSDMMFLKKVMAKLESLDAADRHEFMRNVNLAIKFFDNPDE